jgi:hypothetical protein
MQLESTIYSTRGEHANHYTIDVVPMYICKNLFSYLVTRQYLYVDIKDEDNNFVSF